jgi:hypothetical protein
LEQVAALKVKGLLTHTEHFPEYCHPPLSKQEKLVVAAPLLVCSPVLQVHDPELREGCEHDAIPKEGGLLTQDVQNPYVDHWRVAELHVEVKEEVPREL